MIITRTPLRISLGGGGTDLPSYYSRRGSLVISAAIDRYIYVGLNRTFTDDYLIKYAEMERRSTVDEISHPIIREALRAHPIGPALELVSLADIPAGTGLGSSGSFTVGLLRAIYAFQREHVTAHHLAEEACDIEITKLGRSVGKQDQYIAAYGGLLCLDFDVEGRVAVSPLQIPATALHDLEERLLLFFTGYSRNAEDQLRQQDDRSTHGEAAMLANLDAVAELGRRVRDTLVEGDTHGFARLLHEHWMGKRRRSSGMSSEAIDHWYEVGIANGALGGKLVGAGGGGFLLFYAEDTQSLRAAMEREGLGEVHFSFDLDGSTVIVRD
ncbi:MAG: galactokinase [Candidatus Dormibacteria bacterium]